MTPKYKVFTFSQIQNMIPELMQFKDPLTVNEFAVVLNIIDRCCDIDGYEFSHNAGGNFILFVFKRKI